MSKRSKACEFSKEARQEIMNRDRGCIFCQMGYEIPEEFTASRGLQIMHFVPRSQGGLGIPQNGAVGCIYHHMLLDNGKDHREVMTDLFRDYLKSHYKNWDDLTLTYDKWSFLK